MGRVLVLNDTSITGHPGCYSVMLALQNVLMASKLTNITFIGLDRINNKITKKVYNGDYKYLVLNAEGSIHRTSTNPRAQRILNTFNDYLNYIEKSMIVNSSLYEICDEYQQVLMKSDIIYTRDKSILFGNDLDKKLQYVSDLSFLTLQKQRQLQGVSYFHRKRRSSTGALITDSVLPEATHQLKVISQRYSLRYITLENIKTNLPSRLINKLFHIKYNLSDPSTELNKITRYQNAFNKILDRGNYNLFLKEILRSQIVVTGRYHVVTHCIALGVPFLAIESNTHKIGNLLKAALGDRNRLVSVCKLNPDALKKAAKFNSIEKMHIEKFMTNHNFELFKRQVRDWVY
jgi:hypothetical protein